MGVQGGEWKSWHFSSGLADSKALILGSEMEMIWSPYQQADEKIYLLLLIRFCDSHPPLCTCLYHIPGQHRGRTTVHLPLSWRKPYELALASIDPNGCAIPPLYGTPKLSPNPPGCLCSKRGSRAFWNAEQISRSVAEWKMLQRTQAGKSALPMRRVGRMSGQKDPGCTSQPRLLPLGFLDSPWEWRTHVQILYKPRSKVSWLQRTFGSFYQLKRPLRLI